MGLENPKPIGEMLDVIGGWKRLRTFDLIAEGVEVKEIPDELEMSRSGIQPYINDFRESGLVEKRNQEFKLTGRGEVVHDWLEDLDTQFESIIIEGAGREVKQDLEDLGIGFASQTGQEVLETLLEESKQKSER